MATDRRARGEGSVYQRDSDDRWVAVADLGVSVDGRRDRRVFYGETREAAVKKRTAWLNSPAAKRAKRSGTGAATMAEVSKVFLAAVEGSMKPATYRSRKNALAHAGKELGSMRLDRVTDADISALYAKLRKKGNKGGSIRIVHSGLRHFFRWSVERKLISESPMTGVKRPRDERRKKLKVWTPQEAKTLIEKTYHLLYGPAVCFMLRTGARPGECFALQMDCVDLARRTIRIEATLGADGTLGPPKTKSSERTIQIDDTTVALLRALPWSDGFVFRGRDGKAINESSFRRTLKSYCKRKDVSIPALSPHSCRHSHATFLLLDGVPPHEVAARLGHKDATETLETYAHYIPTLARSAESISRTLG